MICAGFIAIGMANAMIFGALGFLLSAIATLAILLLFFISNLALALHSDRFSIRHPLVKLAATYCAVVGFYFLSYGPATWVLASFYTPDSKPQVLRRIHGTIYSPVTRCIVDSPVKTINDVGVWYLNWWLPPDVEFYHRGRNIGWYTKSELNPTIGATIGITPPLISE